MAEDDIKIVMEPAHPGDSMVKLRITPGYEGQLAELAERDGFAAGEIIEMAAGVELAILGIQALAAGGGLAGFAAVLNSFFGKNRHKKITVTVGDETVSIEGMSSAQSEATMLTLLDKVADQQKVLDESWERVQREWDEQGDS